MVRRSSVPVICSECGKRLRGQPILAGAGFYVLRHVRADAQRGDSLQSAQCWGARRTDHVRAPRKATN